jgi:hypothetical protein
MGGRCTNWSQTDANVAIQSVGVFYVIISSQPISISETPFQHF